MRGLISWVMIGMANTAYAAAPLTVTVEGIAADAPIPEQYALCKATADGKSDAAKNMRPAIRWGAVPEGTKSIAVFVTDPDVPADFSKAGKDGKTVEKDDPRQLFFHWALVDISPSIHEIPGGKSEIKPDFGKPASNSLGSYVSDTHNYGGPCPPWNDARVHHYHFSVFALDQASLELKRPATAKAAWEAVKDSPHVLAAGEVVGTYTLNPSLRPR